MTRALAVVAYVGFACAFGYMVLFLAGVHVPRTVDSGPQAAAWLAVAVDLLLIAFFGAGHSLLARRRVKQALARFVPPAAERSVYVLVASLQLAVLFALWLPLPGALWRVTGPAAGVLWAVQGLGWLTVLASSFHIDHLALFGLRQAFGLEAPAVRFGTPGLYRIVRHPLYFGMLLAMWSTPVMTAGHLLFAAAMTAYVVIGARHEERDLMREFGDAYGAYAARVPMLVPGLGLGLRRSAGSGPSAR